MIVAWVFLLGMGILLILGGFLLQYEHYIRWVTRMRNSMYGIRTEITKQTIASNKLMGIIAILVGVILLLALGFALPLFK